MKLITAKVLADRVKKSERYIQNIAKDFSFKKINGRYQFTNKQAQQIVQYIESKQTTISHEANKELNEIEENTITEEFSSEQYEALQEVIANYKVKTAEIKHLLKTVQSYEEQIRYLRDSLKAKDNQMSKLIDTYKKLSDNLSERNWIELQEKNLPTPHK